MPQRFFQNRQSQYGFPAEEPTGYQAALSVPGPYMRLPQNLLWGIELPKMPQVITVNGSIPRRPGYRNAVLA
jgi:hypothetical protein